VSTTASVGYAEVLTGLPYANNWAELYANTTPLALSRRVFMHDVTKNVPFRGKMGRWTLKSMLLFFLCAKGALLAFQLF
jgi:hypothetical protein